MSGRGADGAHDGESLCAADLVEALDRAAAVDPPGSGLRFVDRHEQASLRSWPAVRAGARACAGAWPASSTRAQILPGAFP